MSETGFADPLPNGGEGDNGAPKQVFARSPIKVLKALEDQPLRQAIKAIEYIDACRERERRLLKVLSPTALDMVAANGPSYFTSVQAVS